MEFDDLCEKMFKEIAAILDMRFTKTSGGYMLSNNNSRFGFVTFLDRDGKLKITISLKETSKPIDLGNYTIEELKDKNSKAKRTIIAKLIENKAKH